MKNYFLILTLCCAVAFVGCKKEEIETIPQIPEDMEIAFPDPNFREYVLTNFDSNGDGKISKEEANAVTKIDFDNYQDEKGIRINSLEGIKYFTNLTFLDCGYITLSSLDISDLTKLSILYCDGNNLTFLDVSKNTQLTQLYCGRNDITTLDLSKNKQLTRLQCQYCHKLTTLDVSKTNLGNSTDAHPLYCAPMWELQTLYLKKGWSIKGITEERSTEYIPAQTEIVFVD